MRHDEGVSEPAAIITLQYLNVSNHYIVHLKLIPRLCQLYLHKKHQ